MTGLELIMCSEVFLVLIKLSARSHCRVKFSNCKYLFFFGMAENKHLELRSAVCPSVNSLNDTDKLICYMSQENNDVINKVAKYVYNRFQERKMFVKGERKAGSSRKF